MKRGYTWLLILPVLLTSLFLMTPAFASWAGIPDQIRVFPGDELTFQVQLPFNLVDSKGEDVTGPTREFILNSEKLGTQEFQVRLFGLFPVRDMVVDVVPEVKVFPGGQSIGVLINPQGLVVNRVVPVRTLEGREEFPAADAGIQPGDIIVSIGGEEVRNPQDVSNIVNRLTPRQGQLEVEIQRGERRITRQIRPILSEREDFAGNRQQIYLLGLYLEDPAAGVGTLSFYDPATGRYGALGHTITDGMGRSIDVRQGTIVEASIDSIKQGLRGIPGEKLGTFQDERDILGNIDKNTSFGIYGALSHLPQHPYFSQPIPVALAHQVQTGPAEIYTVVSGDEIQRFEIEITRVVNQSQPDDKGLIIRVTDSRLLAETGGIVQGMSGSPIVQNGMLVGAVTHVFINDPTRGYGNLIEWMIYEAGLAENASTDYRVAV